MWDVSVFVDVDAEGDCSSVVIEVVLDSSFDLLWLLSVGMAEVGVDCIYRLVVRDWGSFVGSGLDS